jgi:hypothetical protein
MTKTRDVAIRLAQIVDIFQTTRTKIYYVESAAHQADILTEPVANSVKSLIVNLMNLPNHSELNTQHGIDC